MNDMLPKKYVLFIYNNNNFILLILEKRKKQFMNFFINLYYKYQMNVGKKDKIVYFI